VKVKIELVGIAPLLMHNARLSDPLDEIARAMKEVSAKRKKTDADIEELARLEFLGSIYWTNADGAFLPGANIEKSLVEGGRITKEGKSIERGLFVEAIAVPLQYDGPTTPDELWTDDRFRSRMSVKVGQSRVMRTRPIFESWSLSTVAHMDETVLNLGDLQRIARQAGEMVGLGDYRPRFGRFTAEISAA
jgi:hypothetical protein